MADLIAADFFLPDGNVVGGRVRGWPIDGEITQTFGMLSVTGSRHSGMDIGPLLGDGAPIYPFAAGIVHEVWLSTQGRQLGNYVVIDHPDTPWYSAYGHMKYAPAVTPGQWVNEGDLLGYVGNTGVSFGSHLHLGISTNPGFPVDFGQLTDPANYASYEETDMGMTTEERASLDLARNVLYRWGIPGIPYESCIDLFPAGTAPVQEGATGPLIVLTGDNAEGYVARRGFSFGMSLLQHLYSAPSVAHDTIPAHGTEVAPPVGKNPPALVFHGPGSGKEGGVE